jgi:hypothetical protein
MLRASIFSKATAYVRIASSICDLGLYIPVVGLYISIFSVLFLFIWNILIARKCFELGKGDQNQMKTSAPPFDRQRGAKPCPV